MPNLKNKILSDQFIPVILLFSFIISLLLSSYLPFNQSLTNVLGAADPPSANCKSNQCGSCRNCGSSLPGEKGLSCGPISRCVKENDNYYCRFDLNCFTNNK